MTSHDESDRLFLLLARLPSAVPDAERDARITRRCHAVLATQLPKQTHSLPSISLIAHVGNLALTAVLCAYAVVALLEAFRLTVAI